MNEQIAGMEGKFIPEKIYLDKTCDRHPLARKIIQRLKGIPIQQVADTQDLLVEFQDREDPIGSGKKNLLITRLEGPFIKPCPCTPAYIGCGYQIINADINCPYDCSYCILQDYLSHSLVTIHVNTQDLRSQLDSFLRQNPRYLRIGTGELGDSLAMDHLTDRSAELIPYFRKNSRALFELKTKSVNIGNLLLLDPPENVVVAWSLNSRRIARSEENLTPGVGARIEAAQLLSERGYRVAFHFDPLVLYPGWEEGYREIVATLLSAVNPERIAWISLGSLRFPPALKPVIQRRFPDSKLLCEELIKGMDGKFRYFKPLRLEMYRKVLSYFQRETNARIRYYFCMESQEIWEKALKIKPRGKEEVEKLLSLPSR